MQKITFIALCFCLLLGSCKKGSNDGGVEQPILDTKTKVVLSIPERIVRNANGNQRTSITTNGAQSTIFFSREDAEITVYNEGNIVVNQTVTGDLDTLELGLGTYTLDIQYAYPPDDLGKEVSLRYQQEITVEDGSGISVNVDWQLQNVPFVLTFNETLVNQLGGNGFDIQVAHPNGGTLNYVYHGDSVYFGFAANFPTEAETVTFTLSGNGKSFERNYDLGEDSTNILNFQIVNSQLRIQNIEESITIDTRNDDIDVVLVNPPNNPPTAIALSNTIVAEDEPVGTLIGTLTTEDVDVSSDIHSYRFAAGLGDYDNGLFSISGDSLLSAEALDYESDSTLNIRLQTEDSNEGTFEMTFTIRVSDIMDESPPTLTVANFSVSEFFSVGDTLGQIGANDDVGIVAYTLVSGNVGDAFELTSAGFLRLAAALDFETLSAYTLGIEVRDAAGNSAEADFSIAVRDSFQLISVANVPDGGSLELEGAFSVSTAVVSGTTYLFVAGSIDDGVSVFRVASDGALTSVFNISDDGALQLNGARSVSTAVVSGTTYLFVAGEVDDGVSVFSVASDGALTSVFNISDDGALQLNGARSVSTAVVSDTTYLFVAGRLDNGVSVFRVASDGALTSVFNITDAGTLALNGASSVSTAVVSGTTYLLVAGQFDDGVSVFSVASGGVLTSVFNIDDDGTLNLHGAVSVSTAVVSGTTYLFVAGAE